MFIEGEIPNVVTTNGGNYGNGGGFFNGDGIWAIILFAMIFGRNGNGSIFGGGSGGVGDNYVLATDFATIERKLDSIANGICDSTFALNNTITNGNFNIINSLTQGFAGLNTALLQGNYALSSQFADCCCKTARAIDGVNYNLANSTCAITNAINMGVRDIVDNQNANYRSIHEELVANKIEAKNERIAEQQAQITALQLKASQEAQNNYLINVLTDRLGTKCPQPAYVVQPPQQITFPTDCCGNVNYASFNNGCGCC